MWFLPTRRRIKLLTQCIESLKACNISTPGRILVQDDEFKELENEYRAIELPKDWEYQLTKSEGMGDKIREFRWQDYEWVGWLVDDLIAKTPEWDIKLLSSLNGKNYVSAYDGGQQPTRMCVPIFSKRLLEAVGYIYPPGFWHTYVDDVWETLGRATGCWNPNLEVILDHHHSFVNGALVNPDETTIKSYSKQVEDQQAWIRWQKYAMPAAVNSIKAMQSA